MAFISSEHKNKMYKSERMAIIAVLLIVVIIVAVVCLGAIDNKETQSVPEDSGDIVSSATVSGENSNAGLSGEEVGESSTLPIIDTPIEYVALKVDNSLANTGELILVNKDHEYVVDNYEKDLINVYDKFNTQHFMYADTDKLLLENVAKKLSEMCAEFTNATNLKGIMLGSSYVSKETQQSYYDSASEEDKLYTQMGGFSEHHTGLSFDLAAYGSGFEMGENQYAWFNENCWKYGFIVRYPEGKETITFVKNDTDHFRYVGVPHALYMYRYSLTFEEYIEYLKGITNESPLMLGDGTTSKYQAYSCKVSDGGQTEIMVPSEASGWSYQVSGTNDGYFIVTLTKNEK